MKSTCSLLAASMIAVMSAGASADGFGDGLAAYRSRDYAAAHDAWHECATKGAASCQFGLGVLHDAGQGVVKDGREAVTWYERAAAQEYPDALMQLGFLYAVGRERVAQRPPLAWAWFARAAAVGVPEAAAHRDRVGAMLTEEELAQAQRMADEFSIRYHLQK